MIERLTPWVFDAAKRLPLHVVRKHNYETVKGTALITGASSGLGRELVKLYAKQCGKIYVTARNIDALRSLRKELEGQCEIFPIQTDFEDEAAVDSIKAVIGEQKIDLLVNNAGHHVKGSLLNVGIETMENTMMVNFFIPIALMAAFSKTSTMVNVLSTTAIAGRRDLGVYSSTKAGLWCFSKALRRTRGKTINVIDVIPATFQSSLVLKGEKIESTKDGRTSRFSSAKDCLNSMEVAKIVKQGIDKKRDVIYIPSIKTRLFLILEALAPNMFRKLFQ